MNKTKLINALVLAIQDIKELSEIKVQHAESVKRSAEFMLSESRIEASKLASELAEIQERASDDVARSAETAAQALRDAVSHREMCQDLQKEHDELAHKYALSVEEVDSLKHQLDKAKQQSNVANSQNPAYQKLEQEFLGFRAGHEQAQQRWRAENDCLREQNEKLQKYKNKLLKDKKSLQNQLQTVLQELETVRKQIETLKLNW